VLTNKGEPLAIANSMSEATTMLIALAVAGAVVVGLYRWSAKSASAIEA